MNAKIISFVAQKGGTGKTTMCYTFAYLLKENGFKVLMIDSDPQASLTFITGTSWDASGLYEILTGQVDTLEAISETKNGLYVVPNKTQSYNIGRLPADALRQIISDYKNNYDYILIDTPPTMGDIMANTLNTCDLAIITICPDSAGAKTMHDLKTGMFEAIENAGINKELKTRVLINQTNHYQSTKDRIEALERFALSQGLQTFTHTIRTTTAINNAIMENKTLFETNIKTSAKDDFKAVLNEIKEALEQ